MWLRSSKFYYLLRKKRKETKFNEKIGCDMWFYDPYIEILEVAKNTQPRQREGLMMQKKKQTEKNLPLMLFCSVCVWRGLWCVCERERLCASVMNQDSSKVNFFLTKPSWLIKTHFQQRSQSCSWIREYPLTAITNNFADNAMKANKWLYFPHQTDLNAR